VTRRLRVAHVITRLCKGGAQENTFHTVRLANRARFDVDLISGPTEGCEGSIEDAVAAAGIGVLRVPALVREAAPIKDLAALRHLTRLFRARNYDIVHTHTSKAGFVGRIAARRAGVPVVIHTAHGNVFDGYFNPVATRLFVAMERFAARRCDRIIELTPGGIEEHLEQGIGRREQFCTIFSGIDLEPFDEAVRRRADTRRALGIPPDALLVGAVGRLEPIKGFTYFVDAARRVADSVPGAVFVLAGQGSLDGSLRAQAEPLGARTPCGRFRFLGPRDDVPDLMAAFDVFVLPSLNEGMGRVLLEAGAAGTARIATRVGGVPDIVRDGETGLLVPPRDARAIADAVLELERNPARRAMLGAAARADVVPQFGLEQMVMRIEALYEDAVRGNARARA
jgi:glycosyltransferase involved in cell wall biosynthesis